MSNPITLMVVPHTHWDREWYLTFQQFRMRLVRCIDHVLRILDSDPAFTHFTLDGQTIVLSDYLEVRPEETEHLQRYGRAGRLLVGPWYVQPDEFLVGGEAIIRNLLIGRRMATPFGGAMAVGYVPDTFGHIAQLPQIMRGFGIDNAVFWRGVGSEAHESEFWWKGPDGSQIRVMYLSGDAGYSNARELPLQPDELVARVTLITTPMLPHATTSTILLMNGSDHLEPQDGLPAAIAAANEQLATKGQRLVIGTLPQYVQAIRAADPAIKTFAGEWRSSELSNLLPGVTSSRMWIKQRNAAAEALLTGWAEPLATWAWALGAEYPAGMLDIAWRFLLQNQPHDSICGCSIDQVHREMVPRYDQCEQIGEALAHAAFDHIASQVDTRTVVGTHATNELGGSVPVVVMNPSNTVRNAVSTIAVQLAAPSDTLVVVDDLGTLAPHVATEAGGRELFRQAIPAEHVESLLGLVENGRVLGHRILATTFDAPDATGNLRVWVAVSAHGEPDLPFTEAAIARIRAEAQRPEIHAFEFIIRESAWAHLRFAARDLPPLGGRAFLVRPRQAQDVVIPSAEMLGTATMIENAYLRITVERETGELTLTDKLSGAVYPHLHQFQDSGDVGDLYNYSPPHTDLVITTPSHAPEIILIEANAVAATLRVVYHFAWPARCADDRQARYTEHMVESAIVSDITLTTGARHVAITTTVDNHARDHRLRVLFPTAMHAKVAAAEGTFMVNERAITRTPPATGWQGWAEDPVDTYPQKRFVSISDGQAGLALLNRGLAEYEALPGANGVTLALTLLRCVEWLSRDDFATRRGHAGPGLQTPEAQMEGRWTFSYGLAPLRGTWQADEAQAQQEAAAFTAPVWTRPTDVHAGTLPTTWSFLRVGPDPLEVSAIKRAEDGGGMIVRWYNPADTEVIADLATILPCDHVFLANLDEEIIAPITGEADAPHQHWRIATPAGGIVTVRLELPNIH